MSSEELAFNQKHFTKVILQCFSMSIAALIGILSWYLSSINNHLKELSVTVAILNTSSSLANVKIENVDRTQKGIIASFDVLKEKISSLEKEIQSIKTELSHHANLISDKRRCITCLKNSEN